jgi:hypothetical protein
MVARQFLDCPLDAEDGVLIPMAKTIMVIDTVWPNHNSLENFECSTNFGYVFFDWPYLAIAQDQNR